MITVDTQKKLLAYIENNYNSNLPIEGVELPPQGMSSSVFFIKLSNGKDYAVKYGEDAMNDVPVLDLIAEKHIHIPVPTLFTSFVFEDIPVIILERIDFPLLEDVSSVERPKYIPSIIKNLNELHSIKSDVPGSLVNRKEGVTWKGLLLSFFDDSDIDWSDVVSREGLDRELVLTSVQKIKIKLENAIFDIEEYSLLHTDFNQRNLFVNPSTHEISGIIDWEESMFGDPLYDFARVRMYLWHFGFSEKSVNDYYALVNFSTNQKKLEELYMLCLIIQYLAWYSEELTEFNVSRIKLHQEYLRKYIW